MGKQVNFYMLPEDQLAFEKWLKARGDVCFLKQPQTTSELEIAATLVVSEIEKTWLDVYLARPIDLEDVLVDFIPTQNYWLVDDSQSPVVEFGRCFYDGRVLGRGRLYFRTGFLSEDEVEKELEFAKWAGKLLRWIRAHYERDPKTGIYIAPHAKNWVLNEGGQLRIV